MFQVLGSVGVQVGAAALCLAISTPWSPVREPLRCAGRVPMVLRARHGPIRRCGPPAGVPASRSGCVPPAVRSPAGCRLRLCRVRPERDTGIAPGSFLRPALRTGRARFFYICQGVVDGAWRGVQVRAIRMTMSGSLARPTAVHDRPQLVFTRVRPAVCVE